MNKSLRIAVGALGLSMAGFVGIASHEGYTDKAVIPTKNDRPTLGLGSTFNADGTQVKMGDTITPPRAIVLAAAHISKEEVLFRASIPNVALHQAEYDVYMDWDYQFGFGAWVKSSMRSNLLKGDYRAACNALLLYKKSGGFDCSIPGNKICAGVWKRQIERHDKCMEAQ
jgi:lysozyme